MRFPQPLAEGRLRRRYKRFLADIELTTGETITAHCANPGSMIGLAEPGMRVFVSKSDSKTRKLKWSWELVEADGTLVGINTAHPNGIVADAIASGAIPELAGYDLLRREVRYGTNSRIDILLQGAGKPDAYVEVKNVHLSRRKELAEFPDSVTARGAKHLRELSAMVAAGHRATMVYLVHRGDTSAFAIAGDIDPTYAAEFSAAVAAGVEMLAYACNVTVAGVEVTDRLPIAGN
jgi:sugar fermentation stimulation protein A